MAHQVIIRRRSGSILFFETAALSLTGTILLMQRFEVNWAWGVIASLGIGGTVLILFFRVKVFRYLFSFLFSLLWGLLVLLMLMVLDKDSGQTAGMILGALAFAFSLLVHWRAFLFYRNATVVEVEEE